MTFQVQVTYPNSTRIVLPGAYSNILDAQAALTNFLAHWLDNNPAKPRAEIFELP